MAGPQPGLPSGGYFKTPDDTLDAAQEQKLDHICRKLMLKPGERLLDIGCGWGGLVLWAARHYGVKALGVTLSTDSSTTLRSASAISARGAWKCACWTIATCPRSEPFDKIASVGMFEHVGRRNLPAYFEKIDACSSPAAW